MKKYSIPLIHTCQVALSTLQGKLVNTCTYHIDYFVCCAGKASSEVILDPDLLSVGLEFVSIVTDTEVTTG